MSEHKRTRFHLFNAHSQAQATGIEPREPGDDTQCAGWRMTEFPGKKRTKSMKRLTILLAAISLVCPAFARAVERNFDPSLYKSLQECVDEASRWGVDKHGVGVVTLSGSVYEIPAPLKLRSNLRLQGTKSGGKTVFHFTGAQSVSTTDITGVLSLDAGVSNISIENIDFTRLIAGSRGGGWGGIFGADVAIRVVNPVSQVKVLRCSADNYTALYESINLAKWSSDIEIGNCSVIRNQAYMAHVFTTKRLNFHDNSIEQVNLKDGYTHAGAIFRGVQDSAFTNNSLNLGGGGKAFNGFLFEAMSPVPELKTTWGASNVNLTIRGNRINRTQEEGILIERTRASEECCVSDVVSATPTTLTRKAGTGYGSKGTLKWSPNLWKDRSVIICNGRGLGQVRMATGNTESVLTIDKPWDIVPDSTSVFSVTHHTNNVLIENNTISNTGKASIAPYECCGTVVRNNDMTGGESHAWDQAIIEMMMPNVKGEFGDDNGLLWPNYNNLISGNRMSKCGCPVGIRVGNTNFGSQQSEFRVGIGTYNVRIEKNIVDMADSVDPGAATRVGIVVESGYLNTLKNVVVSQNTIKNSHYGIWVGAQFETYANNIGILNAVYVRDNKFEGNSKDTHISEGVWLDVAPPVPNLASNAFISASSSLDRNYLPEYANDGSIASGGWSCFGGKGEIPWLQFDLGASKELSGVEVFTRQDLDQPDTRKNFEVWASNDPRFASHDVLGKQGATPLAFKENLVLNLANPKKYRYVRVAKTKPEYFFLAEVRIFDQKDRH